MTQLTRASSASCGLGGLFLCDAVDAVCGASQGLVWGSNQTHLPINTLSNNFRDQIIFPASQYFLLVADWISIWSVRPVMSFDWLMVSHI